MNQTPQTSTTPTSTPAPKIMKVIVKPRVNERTARLLIDAGVPFNVRTTQRQNELTTKNAQAAQAAGRDGFRGDRIDAAGNVQADTDAPVFGWDAEGRQSVSLRHVLADVRAKFGWEVTAVSMFRKEGDRMYFLVIVLEDKPAMAMTPALHALLGKAMDRVYGHLHVYRNLDGSVTVNPAHALDEGQAGEIRDLRLIDREAHMRCVLRG